ncbi:ABC transporter permease [Clostridium novyi]|uniref:ABC transporter permease n=1 Tax=Clostridium novyi TaxID=1542 RepID=UPI000ABCB459|nr:ABC transporter permease [Clostridium novyi]
MNSYSQITWRYLKQNKKRTILTTIGIIIAISLFSGIATFMFSIQQGLIEQKRQQNGDWEFQFCNLNLDKVSKIKNNFEVKNYSVETKKDKLMIKDGKNKWITFIKSDYDSLNLVFPVRNLEGKIPTNSSEIIMSKNTKRILNKDIGDIITIGKNENLKNYKIVGFDKDLVSGEQILAKTYLDSSKLKEGELYNLSVNLKEKKDKRAIAKKIGNRLDVKIAWECEDENYKTKSYVRCNDGLLQVMGQSVNQMFNGAVNGLIIIVISIIIICTVAVIYNAFNISVAERINEFGILRSIGATPGKIRKLVLQEALFMGAIAIPIGIIAGYMGIYTTVYLLSKSKNFIFNSMMHVGFYPQIILVSFVLGAITILLSVFGPAISASRIAPIDAIRNSSNIKKEKFKRRRAFLTKAIFGIEGDIAYKNIRRNNKRFLITIFSLVVSVVMFNTFTAYTHVFKDEAKNVIEDVNYEGMIYSFNAKSSISSSFINELKNRNEIKEVGSIINANDLLCIEQKFINDKYYKKLGKKIPKGIKIGQNQYVNIPQVSYCAYDSSALKEAKKYLIEGTIDETSLNNGGVLLVDTNKSLNKQSKKKVMDRLLKYKVGDQIKIPRIDRILHGENRGNHGLPLEINSQPIDKRAEKAIKDDNFITVKVVGILSKDAFKGTFQGEHASLIFSMNGFNKKTR